MNTSNIDKLKLPKKATKYHKRHLKAFIKKLGLEAQLPKLNKDRLFWDIMGMNAVVFDFIQDDFEMPPHLLTEMEQVFHAYLHLISYDIPERDVTLTLFETVEMARRFRHGVRGRLREGSKVFRVCDEWIEHLWRDDILEMSTGKIMNNLHLICFSHSQLDNWIYNYDMSVGNHPSNPLKFRYKFIISRKKATVYNRTGEYLRRYFQLEYGSGDGEFIPFEAVYEKKNYPIFFQPHALKRVEERLHYTTAQVYYQLLFHANYKDIRTYRGKYLVPHYSASDRKYKLGYFIGEFEDDRLLINTFLFISQDNTPEGDKLNELLEINKVEKEYLQLDELRYFINSDLKDDETLQPILKAAQLDHLFGLHFTTADIDFTENAEFLKEMIPIEQIAV